MSEARFWAAGLLGKGFLTGLFSTIRFRVEGEEPILRLRRAGQPVIFVFWHEALLPISFRHRDTNGVALVSEHADGEYITRVIERLGYRTVRGSSTRGGIGGLKGLIRAARTGHDVGVTVDGPRGPARKLKTGALLAAQTTGLPVVPLAAAASAAWRFDSWDRFMVPRPFSTLRIAYGEPRLIERDAGPEELDGIGRDLERELNDLTLRCEAAS